jgi:hypothetical protein
MTSLIDLLTPRYAPIQSFIISCLDIGDIVALTRTCRALTDNYSTSKALKFDINILLKIWFQDPCAFRSVQGQCHALKDRPYTSLHRACFKVSEKLTLQSIKEVRNLSKEE